MGKIKVIVKRPDEGIGHVTYISNNLKNLQNTVGGYIQVVPLAEDVLMICNEEGKLLGLDPNFPFKAGKIYGTVIITGVDGDEFTDIPDNLTIHSWERFLINEFLKYEPAT